MLGELEARLGGLEDRFLGGSLAVVAPIFADSAAATGATGAAASGDFLRSAGEALRGEGESEEESCRVVVRRCGGLWRRRGERSRGLEERRRRGERELARLLPTRDFGAGEGEAEADGERAFFLLSLGAAGLLRIVLSGERESCRDLR